MMTAVAIVSLASVAAAAPEASAPEATAVQSDASTSSSTQAQPRRRSSSSNNSMRDNSLRDSMRMRSSSTRRRSATSPMSQRVTAGSDMRQQAQRQSYHQVPTTEDAGGEENNNHYRMTLLTEFRQIVQYTRTKRRSPKNRSGETSVSNNGEVKKRSFQSPPKNALRKKRIVGIGNPHFDQQQTAGEDTREPPLRRATHSFNDRIKKSTFSRNVDYLQEQTKQSFERRLSNASTSSLTATTVDTAASSISSDEEDANNNNNNNSTTDNNTIPSSPTGLGRYLAVQRSASFNAVLDWKRRNQQQNLMEDESISIHDHNPNEPIDDDDRSECPSEMSYGGGSEVLSSSLLDTILRGGSIKGSIKESTFHKNVDYLQAKTEELSRSVHGSSRSLMYNHYQQQEEAGEQHQTEEEEATLQQEVGEPQEEEICRSIPNPDASSAVVNPPPQDEDSTAAADAATSSSALSYYGLDYFHNVMTQTIQECLEEDAASCCSSGEGNNASMHGSLAMSSDGEFPPSTFSKNVDYLQETAHGFTQSVLETSEEFTKSVVETTTSVVETAVSYTTFEEEDDEEAPSAAAEEQDNKEEVAPQEDNETGHQARAGAVTCSNNDDQREEEEVANVEEKEEQVEQDNNDKNLFLRNVDFLQEQAEELTKSWATGLSSWWAGSGGGN